jgi:hypothetical protein
MFLCVCELGLFDVDQLTRISNVKRTILFETDRTTHVAHIREQHERQSTLTTHMKMISNFSFMLIPVPPHQILVYDASGRDVAGSVGPLLEGDNLILTCEVRGGKFTLYILIKIYKTSHSVSCLSAVFSHFEIRGDK